MAESIELLDRSQLAGAGPYEVEGLAGLLLVLEVEGDEGEVPAPYS